MENNYIITIDRENGSGGRYIAETLAKNLNIKCFDEELLKEASKRYKAKLSNLKKNDEKKPSGILYFGGQNIPNESFILEAETIKYLANKESCIIIGRCSNYILNNNNFVFNIFLNAPLSSRIERVCRRNNIDPIKAEKKITKEDKIRASYYNFYTSKKWGDSKNYDLAINTSKIGIDNTIKTITDAFINFKNKKDKDKII